MSTPASSINTEGCYLLYESDSGGKLTLHYSRSAVPGAVGFWFAGPSKKIQGFKFSQNSGRVELIKGISGGDKNKKKYFSGWCQFIKAAKLFGGAVQKFPDRGGIEVDLYGFCREGNEMKPLDIDDGPVDVSGLDAVACLPKHNDAYTGIKNFDVSTFVSKGNMAGAVVTL